MRLHSIRQDGGAVIATYRDDDRAHRPISAGEAKMDFLGRCDREIARHRQALVEWERARLETGTLSENDFQPAAGNAAQQPEVPRG